MLKEKLSAVRGRIFDERNKYLGAIASAADSRKKLQDRVHERMAAAGRSPDAANPAAERSPANLNPKLTPNLNR